jgi:hypothetical protein
MAGKDIITDAGKDTVDRVLGELLRAPEPVADLDVQRALTRLLAARGDAAYLLLHRVLVLETALQQLRQGAPCPSSPDVAAGAPAGPPAGPAPARPSTRSFVRDAAVVAVGVTLGVAAGQVLADELLPSADDDALGGLGDLLGGL